MGVTKRQVRQLFRDTVFWRDKYRCVGCGFQSTEGMAEQDLDAHHVTPREKMAAQGYVTENGVSLCKTRCHLKAECTLELIAAGKDYDEQFSPESLYRKIGSSFTMAVEASERLKGGSYEPPKGFKLRRIS